MTRPAVTRPEVPVPPSLATDELAVLWALVRDRLEHNGDQWRGRVRIPLLTAKGRLALESLVGRRLRSQVGFAEIETGLARIGVAEQLPNALTQLGFPPIGKVAARRSAKAAATAARDAARNLAAGWPEPWAGQWIDGVIRAGILAGLDVDSATTLVTSTRRVVDALGAPDAPSMSRVDLAARWLGSSHALDTGTRIERAVTRALSFADDDGDDGRSLWERSGAHSDLVSGAALTWNLPLTKNHPLAIAVKASTNVGVPFVFTQLALRSFPVELESDSAVLVVENPRVLEHAAQIRSAVPVVCANGNPSATVQRLVRQLVDSGIDVRYHGDFDAAGIAMCARMIAAGAVPWQMTAHAYRAAVADAAQHGIDLPLDSHPSPPTPWDPELAIAFDRARRIVHEERLLDLLV